jgi:hypothetical protein
MRIAQILLLLLPFAGIAQKNKSNQIARIDPAFWWAGMNNPQLELLVYNPQIANCLRLFYP